jgi:pyridoxal phosphate enzyme (YggS family)
VNRESPIVNGWPFKKSGCPIIQNTFTFTIHDSRLTKDVSPLHMISNENFNQLTSLLQEKQVTLVAVSKTKSITEIKSLYDLGQRDFGENYVQELIEKQQQLPKDIRWHFIGHLQTNKVKFITPFISMIQSVDSFKLLKEINKHAIKEKRVIDILLQVHIAREETKFGMDESELNDLFESPDVMNEMKNIRISGFMGMASFTSDSAEVKKEFNYLKKLYDHYKMIKSENTAFSILSMGMSSDYALAVDEGSSMVRIGSLLFGERTSI